MRSSLSFFYFLFYTENGAQKKQQSPNTAKMLEKELLHLRHLKENLKIIGNEFVSQ